jgi:hypothetical protein
LFISILTQCAQILIFLYRLQPFIGSLLSRNLNCQMGKPAIWGGSMPMLYTSRNVDHISGK